jgi:hypothetical protein
MLRPYRRFDQVERTLKKTILRIVTSQDLINRRILIKLAILKLNWKIKWQLA